MSSFANESDSHFLAYWDSGTEWVSGVRVPPEVLVFLSVSTSAVLLIGPWSGELGAGVGGGVWSSERSPEGLAWDWLGRGVPGGAEWEGGAGGGSEGVVKD